MNFFPPEKYNSTVVKTWTFYTAINSTSLSLSADTFLPLEEAVASGAVFVIVSRSDGRADTLSESAK